MASHPTHAARPAFAGHVAAVRPFSAADAFPSYAHAASVKAMWRKATAVSCSTTGLTQPTSTLTGGTDIATWRPHGGT